jgi:hypothetical protein
MDPSRTYVSPPVIAALQDKVRTTALRQMLAGHYGPIIRRGRRNTPYVPLAAVADFHGVNITPDQFAAAVDGHRERFFTIPTESETEAA